MELNIALASLDHEDDAHWTMAGKPNLKVLMEMVGRPVRRAEDGGLTRTSARAASADIGKSREIGEPPKQNAGPSSPVDLPGHDAQDEEPSSQRGAVREMSDPRQRSEKDMATAVDRGATSSEIQLPTILDLNAAETLKEALIVVISNLGDAIVDGSEVARIDTPCLQVLLAAAHDIDADGRMFTLCNPSDQLRSAFEDIGMSVELHRWSQT